MAERLQEGGTVRIDALLACLDPTLPLATAALPEAVRGHIEGLLDARAERDRLRKEIAAREDELSVANLFSLHDEIGRLREELALRDDSLSNRRVRELRVEVERLQAALQEIADNPDGFYGSAASIAREALGG